MKVKELIEKLSKFDTNLDVRSIHYAYSADINVVKISDFDEISNFSTSEYNPFVILGVE